MKFIEIKISVLQGRDVSPAVVLVRPQNTSDEIFISDSKDTALSFHQLLLTDPPTASYSPGMQISQSAGGNAGHCEDDGHNMTINQPMGHNVLSYRPAPLA